MAEGSRLDNHYFETQNFFDPRLLPGDPVVARIHGTTRISPLGYRWRNHSILRKVTIWTTIGGSGLSTRARRNLIV